MILGGLSGTRIEATLVLALHGVDVLMRVKKC